MRVLVAPQEFKGTLTAVEAANAIERGLAGAFPAWDFHLIPMADGGPGTTDAVVTALDGEKRLASVSDPLGRPIEAAWAVLPDGRAVLECAAASGLLRLRADELNPRVTSTYGTGQLVGAALDAGCKELIVGLGGSATNDGGAGLAQALGFRLLDQKGKDLSPGGAALAGLDRIDTSNAHPGISSAQVLGATDVTNPLCGPSGASAIYGPQKGADPAAVAELDAALARFADVVRRELGVDVAGRPGAGAGGGLGAGLIAFMGAELRSGAQVVGEVAGVPEAVRAADLVITGEGRLDGQTAFGKAPQYVARLARAAGRPVVCLAGSLGAGYETSRSLFTAIEALSDGKSPLPGRNEAVEQLEAAALRAVLGLFARQGSLGSA